MKDIKNKDSLLREFLQREYDFCWENQKINYETREKLLRIYIAVLSLLPALLVILYKWENGNSSSDSNLSFILIVALFIILIFSFLTWIRNLSLHLSIIRYRKSMNYLKKRLLKIIEPDENKRKNILKEIPYKDDKELKYINFKSGDAWLIISLQLITASALGLIIYTFKEKLYYYSIFDYKFYFLICIIFIAFFSIWPIYFCKCKIKGEDPLVTKDEDMKPKKKTDKGSKRNAKKITNSRLLGLLLLCSSF